MAMTRLSHPNRAEGETSRICAQTPTTTTSSTASLARPLAAPTEFASLRRPDRFASGASRGRRVDVRLRPRRDGHRAGAQAREAQGEALGTAEEKKVKHRANHVALSSTCLSVILSSQSKFTLDENVSSGKSKDRFYCFSPNAIYMCDLIKLTNIRSVKSILHL